MVHQLRSHFWFAHLCGSISTDIGSKSHDVRIANFWVGLRDLDWVDCIANVQRCRRISLQPVSSLLINVVILSFQRFIPLFRYGICAIMAVVAVPFQYLIYERPQFFVLGLLALHSAGSIITTEHVYVNYQQTTNFDTPALRAGKAMVSLGVALAIVIIFQLFVLRRPARSRLRKQLGKLVYANLAYNTILQAYVRAVLSADPTHRCSPSVLKRIERELKHREVKMQMKILELSPLIA